MAHRAVGAGRLMVQVHGVIASGEQEKVAVPLFRNMNQRHILRGPGIQAAEVMNEWDGPFFDVRDDLFFSGRGVQAEQGQAVP